MTLRNIEGTVDSLHQGVSQQPAIQRSASQCLEQVNCSSSVLHGVTTRPGSFFKEDVLYASDGVFKDKTYFIDKDGKEWGATVMNFNGLTSLMFTDKDGNLKTVLEHQVIQSYLDDGESLKMLQISEKELLVLNTETVTALDTSDNLRFQHYTTLCTHIVFEACSGSTSTFILKVDGTSYAATLTEEELENGATTAAALRTRLMAAGYTTGLLVSGNTMVVRYDIPEDIEIEAYGALSDCFTRLDQLNVCTNEAYLPDYAKPGTVQPMAVGGLEYNMWFVITENPIDASGLWKGYWEESPPVDEVITLDADTFPVLLTFEDDGDWSGMVTCSKPDWITKPVGDDTANPSFIGSTINAIAYKQDRLIFIHDAGITTSRTSEPFNFFPLTMKVAREDTVIDLLTGNYGDKLFAVAEISTHLLIVGTKAQYLISGLEPIGLSTSLVVSTEIPITSRTPPVVAGNRVFILSDVDHSVFNSASKYSKVIEFTVEKERSTPTLVEYTRHVPKYVPSNVKAFALDVLTGTFAILPSGDGGDVIVCQSQKDDSGSLTQQAWSTWEFEGNVIHIIAKEGCLEVVQEINNQATVSVVPLYEDVDTPIATLFLDNKVEVTVQAEGTWDYPSTLTALNSKAIHIGETKLYKSSDVSTPVQGDVLVLGRSLTMKYVPTIPYPAISTNVYIRGVALLIDRMIFWLEESGPININGVTYGIDTVSGTREYLQTRDCNVRLGADRKDVSIEITNPTGSYLPVKLLSYDWFGRLKQAGQRM